MPLSVYFTARSSFSPNGYGYGDGHSDDDDDGDNNGDGDGDNDGEKTMLFTLLLLLLGISRPIRMAQSSFVSSSALLSMWRCSYCMPQIPGQVPTTGPAQWPQPQVPGQPCIHARRACGKVSRKRLGQMCQNV